MDIYRKAHPGLSQLEAEQWAALSDPLRIQLIYTIWDKPQSVSDLAKKLSVNLSTTSRHLRILHEMNLVKVIRQGRSRKYRLTDQRIVDALNLVKLAVQLV